MENVEMMEPPAGETRSAMHTSGMSVDNDNDDGEVLFDTAAVARSKAKKGTISAPDNDGSAVRTNASAYSKSGSVPRDSVAHSALGLDRDTEGVSAAPNVMDFGAFVTGDWSLVPAEDEAELDEAGGSESDLNTLGTPDDDGENESGFVDAFESDDCDEEPAVAEVRRTTGMSLGSISSIRSAAVAASAAKLVRVKEKTQQVAQSQKLALSNFQKRGGLVGWLHGDPGDDSGLYDDDAGSNESSDSDGRTETMVHTVQPPSVFHQQPSPEIDLLRSASPPPAPEQTSTVCQHDSFPPQVSSDGAYHQSSSHVPASELLKKSLLGRQRASSLLGNLYEKVKKSGSPVATPPATPTTRSSIHAISPNAGSSGSSTSSGDRIALQPSPRKESALKDTYSFGFDDFSSAGISSNKHLRQRTASEGGTPLSFDALQHQQPCMKSHLTMASALGGTEQAAISVEDAKRILPLNECLADPKSAAEFVNTVMPNDSALLKLLYSIEEFEALVSTEPIPGLSVQIDYATTVIDRFLVSPTPLPNHQMDSPVGQNAASVLSKLPSNTAIELKQSIEKLQQANASGLPKTFFRDVYDVVYETLRKGYDTFKLTREYALLLEQLQHERDNGADTVNVVTIDTILANEWHSTVFWMYLYRTSHHHRLSFLMEKNFRLDKLYTVYLSATQTNDDEGGPGHASATQVDKAYQRLVAHLRLMSRKFLQKSAPVAVPVASNALCRLKEELCVEIAHVPRGYNEHRNEAMVVMERLMSKLDIFSVEVRKEFKHLDSERFANFVASSLYRDFASNSLVLPSSGLSHRDKQISEARSSKGDIVQLLRASKIPFHQAPNETPQPRVLSTLVSFQNESDRSDQVAALNAIFKVFTFTKLGTDKDENHPLVFEDITIACRDRTTNSDNTEGTECAETEAEENANASQLYQTIEHFLLPEAATRALEFSETGALQNLCYNFVAGDGDNIVYGVAWRFPAGTHERAVLRGICVTSKFPLVDSLRCFLQTFASNLGQLGTADSVANFGASSGEDLRSAADNARVAFDQYLIQQYGNCEANKQILPQVDFSLEDLFDCLSLTHILRVVAFVLLEKKIVLVSSSYSVLLSVGETLKGLIYPLTWSHIYVPVLPLALKEYLHCPTPFIFGLHTSYVRRSDLPRPSDDLVIVNLDRDSLTGGGDIVLPPALSSSLRDKLFRLCRPRLQARDHINYSPPVVTPGDGSGSTFKGSRFPTQAIREAFHEELLGMLSSLESFAFRFEFNGKCAAVVDASNKTRTWTADVSRFHATLLQTQAFSAHLSSLGSLCFDD